jgi:two-component system, response regulator
VETTQKLKISTIMVIEDNPDHIDLVSISLRKSFPTSRLIITKDGEEALKTLDLLTGFKNKLFVLPDIILLDINLPKISGYDVLRKIRADHKFENVPVIVLTTSEKVKDKKIMLSLGANGYLNKFPNGFYQVKKTIDAMKSRNK